jgi:hypothetical protein
MCTHTHTHGISRGVFSHVFTHLNLYRLEVKCGNIAGLYTEGAEVRIFMETAAILTEVFCDFPQSYGSAAIILAGYVITVSL